MQLSFACSALGAVLRSLPCGSQCDTTGGEAPERSRSLPHNSEIGNRVSFSHHTIQRSLTVQLATHHELVRNSRCSTANVRQASRGTRRRHRHSNHLNFLLGLWVPATHQCLEGGQERVVAIQTGGVSSTLPRVSVLSPRVVVAVAAQAPALDCAEHLCGALTEKTGRLSSSLCRPGRVVGWREVAATKVLFPRENSRILIWLTQQLQFMACFRNVARIPIR
jgi:hypothetical protein